jgi:hypothetical protein
MIMGCDTDEVLYSKRPLMEREIKDLKSHGIREKIRTWARRRGNF